MNNENFEIFYGRPKKLLRFKNTLLVALRKNSLEEKVGILERVL